jgi:hypothetical protein
MLFGAMAVCRVEAKGSDNVPFDIADLLLGIGVVVEAILNDLSKAIEKHGRTSQKRGFLYNAAPRVKFSNQFPKEGCGLIPVIHRSSRPRSLQLGSVATLHGADRKERGRFC